MMIMSNKEVKTTGHVWDEDLQEYSNPLPRWWLWTFYGTIIFSLIYWVLYPTFPMGKGHNAGINTITYTDSKGNEHTTPWNTRYLLEQEMNNSPSAVRQKEYLDKVGNASYQDIVNDQDMMNFTRAYAKVVFGDNCATCHQAGGAGVARLFPNLSDDSWLFGGTFERINETINVGRAGIMPACGTGNCDALGEENINALASYVVSLTDNSIDAALAEKGKAVYMGAGACFACHGMEAEGNAMVGAPALKDQIWTIAGIDANTAAADKVKEVSTVIRHGVNQPNGKIVRVMPAWKDRLSPADIKALTVYVHELGGGK